MRALYAIATDVTMVPGTREFLRMIARPRERWPGAPHREEVDVVIGRMPEILDDIDE